MIVHMNYQQYRTTRMLVHSCCHYDSGCCLLLDNGEECVCPQSITYSLICKWFRAAVLPLDAGLCAALLYRDHMEPVPSAAATLCQNPTGANTARTVLLRPAVRKKQNASANGTMILRI